MCIRDRPYNIIDPSDKDSIGLNPFVYDDTNKIAITISSVMKAMVDISKYELFKELQVIQAIENISILLKEMYPKMNEGMLPNLEDMLKKMCIRDRMRKLKKQ